MPELTLLCSRPHERDVNFETSQFIVATSAGLNVNGEHLNMGEIVPPGVISSDALRQEYQTPLRRIETLEYAMTVPDLCEAYARMEGQLKREELAEGVALVQGESEEKEPVVLPDLDSLNRPELVSLCEKYKVDPDGPKRILRQRLTALLG